jgi:hypothetical protein
MRPCPTLLRDSAYPIQFVRAAQEDPDWTLACPKVVRPTSQDTAGDPGTDIANRRIGPHLWVPEVGKSHTACEPSAGAPQRLQRG